MHCETVSTVVKAPREKTFDFLANVENLPKWATQFCRKLERSNGHYVVTSPEGPVLFDIHADAGTGVVDFLAGPSKDQMFTWPARVVGLPSGETLVLFTCLHEPQMSERVFRQQVESVRLELANVRAALE
jgi:hypothetical protein